MTMQRRHFEIIADTFKSAIAGTPNEDQRKGVKFAIKLFAAQLAATNPKFDKERFLEACGYNL